MNKTKTGAKMIEREKNSMETGLEIENGCRENREINICFAKGDQMKRKKKEEKIKKNGWERKIGCLQDKERKTSKKMNGREQLQRHYQ